MIRCYIWFYIVGYVFSFEDCVPGGIQIFPWHYGQNYSAPRFYTAWYHNATEIMAENSIRDIIVRNTTFLDRLMKHQDTNAGLIVNTTEISDTGTFSVEVTFQDGSTFTESAEVVFTTNAKKVSNMLVKYTIITIDDDVMSNVEQNGTVEWPVDFSVNTTAVCGPTTTIEIFYNEESKKTCDATKCQMLFDKPGAITTTIAVPGVDGATSFPLNGESYGDISSGENPKAPYVGFIVLAVILLMDKTCIE